MDEYAQLGVAKPLWVATLVDAFPRGFHGLGGETVGNNKGQA